MDGGNLDDYDIIEWYKNVNSLCLIHYWFAIFLGRQEETRLENWFEEMGLKIRPDVFRHDNYERIIKTNLTYRFVFSQKRNGKR